MVLRRCRQLLGDEDSALDSLQDVFARLLHRKDRGIEFPSSFLYTMATRICIDKMRSAPMRHGGNGDVLCAIASAENIEEKVSAGRMLERLFHREKEDSRVMAVLHYVDGMTLEEVAEQVGLTESGVRKRLQGLKLRLAKLVGKAWKGESRSPAGKGYP